MLAASWLRYARKVLLYVVIGLITAAVIYLQLFPRATLWAQELMLPPAERAASIGLGDYRIIGKPHKLSGLEAFETSGLSYSASSNTLFTVTGKTAFLIELSLGGDVLRQIPINGVSNLEAVEVLSGGRIAVVDERMHRMSVFQVNEHTQSLDASTAENYDLGFADAGNKGFEGLAWDPEQQRLLLAKERDPLGIFSFQLPVEASATVTLKELVSSGLFVRDISSLSYDSRTGNILVLSDESRMLVELDTQGYPLGFINLGVGMGGFSLGIKQPEGVAIGTDGTIYVIAEPDLMYVFRKEVEPN